MPLPGAHSLHLKAEHIDADRLSFEPFPRVYAADHSLSEFELLADCAARGEISAGASVFRQLLDRMKLQPFASDGRIGLHTVASSAEDGGGITLQR